MKPNFRIYTICVDPRCFVEAFVWSLENWGTLRRVRSSRRSRTKLVFRRRCIIQNGGFWFRDPQLAVFFKLKFG